MYFFTAKQCTKPHERYSSCLLGECFPITCADLGRPLVCPVVPVPCAGGCICERGYVKDSKGNCIDVKTCPPRVCPKNEEPGCRNSCPPESCLTKYVVFDCAAPWEGQTCVDGCYCKPGYLRTANGACVPQNECLPLECVDDPNAKRGCGNRCGKTCADYKDKNNICALKPCKKDGCDCKDGFIYDKNLDRCVKPTECTPRVCPPNEQPGCRNPCPPETCMAQYAAFRCIENQTCVEGCFCKPGYLRTSINGTCVLKEECLPLECVNDPNAQRGCGIRCGKTCADYNIKNIRCPLGLCKLNGCDCKDGYVYDNNLQKCVKPIHCTKQCIKPHERYSDCLLGECVPKTCAEVGKPLACPAIAEPCAGGCICEEGFVRDPEGNCIDVQTCPNLCAENEEFYCGPSCPEASCKNPNPPICINKRCEFKCFCKKGFVRGANNKCIPANKCTPRVCPPNEQPGCRNPCPPETCIALYADYRCIENQTCVEGCFCKPGYMRTSINGTCVLREECLPLECIDDPNAQRGCGIRCGNTCADYNVKKKICPLRPCKLNGCDCKDGYVYDNNLQKCVKPLHCTKQCIKPHERYSDCLLGECVPKTCAAVGKRLACPDIAVPCAGGCVCEEGFVRDPEGNCIDVQTCPNLCAENEEFYCGSSCPEASCKNPNPPICINKRCEFKCFCKKGFVRGANNKCIPANKCPSICNKPHERFIDCLAGQCSPKTCDDLGRSIPCPFIIGPCPGGCICEEGYLRAANGTCIKQELCPPKPCGTNQTWVTTCNGLCPDSFCPRNDKPPPPCEPLLPCYPGCQCKLNYRLNATRSCILTPDCPAVKCTKQNEVWDSCSSPCLAEKCEDVNNQPTTCNTLIWLCSPRCICAKGHFRNKDGLCVPASKCPNACPNPNEKYIDCLAGQCNPKTCNELINPAPCPKVRPPCPGGCICVDGYVRDAKGVCIRKEACPKICKKAHERYSTCLLGECVPKTCDDLGKPIACPSIARPCAGGCICEEGYVRDCRGNCIEKKKCPSCGGDAHAESGCGNPCGKTCASLGANKAALFCPLYCETNGCDCKKGYRLNTATNKCVLEKDCPKPPQQCGQNEEYYYGTSCPEASCQNPKPPICMNKKCKKACFCKKGFVRDPTNKCIPVDKCPSPCKGPHERYVSCPAGQCKAKTCDNLIHPAPCPRIIPPCPGGCICEEGYLRDSKGICIPKNKCPQLACNSNQTYVSCNIDCPDKYCPKDDQPQPVCDPPRNCPPGCTCKFNYRLDKSGKCILTSDCPEFNCTGENEVFTSCSTECLAENCEDADKPPAVCNTLRLNCQPKCICKKDHYRNSDGRCVPAKDCPSVCKDPNAQWKDCISPCPGTCQNTKPLCLSKPCTAGCQCNDGYVLSKEGGKCVPIDTCGDYVECGANQTFVPCTFRCPQVMCPKSDRTILCKPPRDCPGGCGCKNNYRYDANDECILGSDCPPVECTRKNEEWAPCRSEYDWERCDDRYNSPPLVPDDDEYCNPRCVCIKGYYRNNNNECVPESECPSVCKDPNAQWKDCISPCPGTCENTKPECSSENCTAGCQCNEGYVLSKEGGKCVPIDTCGDYVECGGNQTFVPCTFRCPQVMCPESDQTILCKPPRDCPGGCGCKNNYRYDANDECILGSDCPPVECTRKNEEWAPCRSEYDWERCDDRFNTPPIVPVDDEYCNPRCVCIKGHYRNNNNECVPESECPPIVP